MISSKIPSSEYWRQKSRVSRIGILYVLLCLKRLLVDDFSAHPRHRPGSHCVSGRQRQRRVQPQSSTYPLQLPHSLPSVTNRSSSGATDLANSRAPGETCLFKRRMSRARKQDRESGPSNTVETRGALTEERREENPSVEGSTCTLYVGPNKVPLRIKCEFVEYI